jgi:tetratricopeptide (TPR) repeat protein
MASDIHALEMAFAKQAHLETCIPLCEAYLQAKRTMEAMIVCKRGIKAQPEDPRGYVLLAKVYLAQGKEQKYREELQQVLAKWPDCSEAAGLLGVPSVSSPTPAPAGAPVAASIPTQAPKAPAQAPSSATQPPLASVQDFFAHETLGFDNDGSHIETAGPGRFTIVGFVPKAKTSWKTILAGVGACVALLVGVGMYQASVAKKKHKILGTFKTMQQALLDDRYEHYHAVLKQGASLLEMDKTHKEALSLMAYAGAVLAVDHGEKAQLEEVEKHLKALGTPSLQNDNVYRLSAAAMLQVQQGHAEQAKSLLKKTFEAGAAEGLLDATYLEVLESLEVPSSELEQQALKAVRSSSGQVRNVHMLARYFYRQGDYQRAENYFSQALQRDRNNPGALMGMHACVLEQNVGVGPRQKTIEADVSSVLALPQEKRSPSLQAFAYYVRAQLLLWQGRDAEAQEALKQVVALDSMHPMVLASKRVGTAYVLAVIEEKGVSSSLTKRLLRAAVQEKKWDLVEKTISSAQPSWLTAGEKALYQGHVYAGKEMLSEAMASYQQVDAKASLQLQSEAVCAYSKASRRMGSAYSDATYSYVDGFLVKNKVLLSAKEQAVLYCERGLHQEILKNTEQAAQDYSKGIEIFRYYAPCHFFLCRILGQTEEASEACKTYLALEPMGEYATQATLLQRR